MSFEKKKVLVVLISRDLPKSDCYQSILNQHYTDYSILQYALRPEAFHPDPTKNKYLNCSHTRNYARVMALSHDADYFLFVDDDVVLPVNAIADLASHKKSIVGGWYPIIGTDKWVGGTHTFTGPKDFVHFTEVKKGLTSTCMIGLGCALISRDLLTKVPFKSGIRELNGVIAGECYSFSEDVRHMGYQLFLDGNVVCGHLA